MAGQITGQVTFGNQPGPVQLAWLDDNMQPMVAALNNLNTFTNYYADTSSVVNQLVVTTATGQTYTLSSGLALLVKIANTNTGAVTLSINGATAVAVNNVGGAPLSSGQIIAGTIVTLIYQGSYWQLGPASSGSGTVVYSPFDIRYYGAVGNGVTDDTAAFTAFNTFAITLGSAYLVLQPGATYLCTNSYWPCNIKDLVVYGNGATLKNPSSSANANILNTWDAYPTNVFTSRYLINSTAIGDAQVTCSTAANAGNFSVGEMVMIGSYDLQFSGFPPCYRFFEYAVVNGTPNASTGVVPLDRSLSYAHLSNFPYNNANPNSDGRANIYKIEANTKFNIHHVYNDITFASNVVASPAGNAAVVYASGYHIEFNRCKADWFNPTVFDTVTFNDCTVNAYCELDKLGNCLTFNDCTILPQVLGATGIRTVLFNNSKLLAGYYIQNIETLEFHDCYVTSPAGLYTVGGTVSRVIVQGGVHQGLPAVVHAYPMDPGNMVHIDGANVTWTESTNTLYLTNFSANHGENFLNMTQVGGLVVAANATGAFIGGYGTVSSITGGNNTANVVISFSYTPLAGTEYLGACLEPATVDIQGKQNYLTIVHDRFRARNVTIPATGNALPSYFGGNVACLGRPKRLSLEVVRPYSGPNNTAQVYIAQFNPNYHNVIYNANLSVAGLREATCQAASGFANSGGESANVAITAGTWVNTMWAAAELGVFPNATVTAPSQSAIVNLEIDFDGPLAT